MHRNVLLAVIQFVVVVRVFVAAGVANAQSMKVACVGDSITAGGSWCAYAGESLGSGYTTQSFGVSGTTLLEDVGQPSFSSSNRYGPSKDFAPNIVVIMLGTNDSMPRNWNAGKDHFVKDYEALIDSYTSLASKPTVFLNTAPPASDNNMFSISGMTIENEINPLIKQVAMTKMCPLVDVWAAFGGDVDKLASFDGVHPGDAGQKVIGEAVAQAIMSPMIPGGSGDTSGGAGAGGGSGSAGAAGGSAQAGAGMASAGASGGGQAGAGATTGGTGGVGAGAAGGTGAAGTGAIAGASGNTGSSTNAQSNPGVAGGGGPANAAGDTGTAVAPVAAAGTSAPVTANADSGGGCRAAGGSTNQSGPGAALLLLLGLVIRRRKAARSQAD